MQMFATWRAGEIRWVGKQSEPMNLCQSGNTPRLEKAVRGIAVPVLVRRTQVGSGRLMGASLKRTPC